MKRKEKYNEKENIIKLITQTIVSQRKYRYMEGYICPYCGYVGSNNTPINAHELAIHILLEHEKEVTNILLE